MKKYFYFLHFLLLSAGCCIAQRQITNFNNTEDKQAFNPVYQLQIGNKLIFSSFAPATGNELWVSEGAKSNTKLLKDITPGYQSTYPYDFSKYGDFVYFVVNGYEIWKTDGSPAGTQKLLHSDSTLNLNIVSGKLLVTFRNAHTQRYVFAWLDTNGKTDFLRDEATAFKYAAGNLYYGSYDLTSEKWTLKVQDSGLHTLASEPGPPLNDIIIEAQSGYEYIAVDAGYIEKKLVVAASNRAETAKIYPWNRGAAPTMLRDKAGSLFLIDDAIYSGKDITLKIFKVIEGQNWETIADIKTSMLYADTPTGSSEGPFHTNFILEGDQLTFTTLFGYENVHSAYLGVFDFKKNIKRMSPRLPGEVTARHVKLASQSRDVFEIRSGNNKCIYNIAENKTISIEQLPYQVQKVKVGNTEYELSDNVYVSGSSLRLPLMKRRPVYRENGLAFRTVLNNKLLFWTNDDQGKGKLWLSDGKTTSELLSYDGTVIPWTMVRDSIRIGNQIVFAAVSQRGIRIFKTNGTPAGTGELYHYPTDSWSSVTKVITNNRLAVFELNVAGKEVSLITDMEKVWEIDDSQYAQREFHATSNDLFMIHSSVKNGISYSTVYKFDNGDLKLIELNKGGADAMNHQICDTRIYYMLRNSAGYLSDVCYTEMGSDKVNRLFTGPMNYLVRRGDCLIAGTMSGPDVKIYKASTGELLGEFTDIYPVDASTSNAVGLWSKRQAVIVHNDRVVSQKFTEDIEFSTVVPQGILIKVKSNAGSSWYIYELKRGKITELFKDQTIDFTGIAAGDQLVFDDNGNNRHQIIWDLAKQKRLDFPAGLQVIKTIPGDLIVAYNPFNNTTPAVYTLEGTAPLKMYELPGWYDFPSLGYVNYTPFSTKARGFELVRIDRDSLYHFPEIIKGPEGATFHEVFHFKGSVYATAFTYSKGLQVWKMDEINLTPDDNNELVASRPEIPDRVGNLPDNIHLNVYPNPVISELNIDLKEGGLIRILDPRGFEQLKVTVGKSKRLDVKSLPPGQYIILYSGANGQSVKKIVKL
ncbi:T9SS type A sorting domain-containing protein [Dyadobacter sp. BHUBP1]|uniref:T9SS type A sorting domain-containing protein n=1 Tax=Dyadobacter sp. BHUBP1 TaxID=3424178 RepID=UPI003D344C5C